MDTTSSFCVYAEWNYSAAFGYLLLFSCQVVELFLLNLLSVIMLDISYYVTRPGYYLVLLLCCDMMGCAFAPLALLITGPISHGPICVNKMIYYVGMYGTKKYLVYQ
jgi:hypothetical protein